MKKTYTKKQITEAIAYWKNQLKKLNETEDADISKTVNEILAAAKVSLSEVETIKQIFPKQPVKCPELWNMYDCFWVYLYTNKIIQVIKDKRTNKFRLELTYENPSRTRRIIDVYGFDVDGARVLI